MCGDMRVVIAVCASGNRRQIKIQLRSAHNWHYGSRRYVVFRGQSMFRHAAVGWDTKTGSGVCVYVRSYVYVYAYVYVYVYMGL